MKMVRSNKDKNLNEKLISIVSEIPEEYLAITTKVVSLFEKQYNKKLNDIIYVSLTEHIHGAIERYKNGIQIPIYSYDRNAPCFYSNKIRCFS